MKLFILMMLSVITFACSKQNDEHVNVIGIDQVTGEWEWLSTCGGLIESCVYSSPAHYAVLHFGSNGILVEMRNDTIYEHVSYNLIKITETSGTLRYTGTKYEKPVSIVNNQLVIGRGELVDTYKKLN